MRGLFGIQRPAYLSDPKALFGGGGGGSKTNIEPAPTRDTAADDAEQERIRRAAQSGRSSTMLTGPYGVASEPVGSRQITAQR